MHSSAPRSTALLELLGQVVGADDEHVGARLVLAELGKGGDAVAPGHAQVEDDHIGVLAPGDLYALLAVAGDDHLGPCELELAAVEEADVGFVVTDQHAHAMTVPTTMGAFT